MLSQRFTYLFTWVSEMLAIFKNVFETECG